MEKLGSKETYTASTEPGSPQLGEKKLDIIQTAAFVAAGAVVGSVITLLAKKK